MTLSPLTPDSLSRALFSVAADSMTNVFFSVDTAGIESKECWKDLNSVFFSDEVLNFTDTLTILGHAGESRRSLRTHGLRVICAFSASQLVRTEILKQAGVTRI